MNKHQPSIKSVLLRLLDESYNRKAWHGTTFRGSLRGLGPPALAWRPQPGRRNIWELALHVAYWKYTVWRRLTGQKRGSFRLKGSNFFDRPEKGRGTEKAWKEELAILEDTHDRLRHEIHSMPEKEIDQQVVDKVIGITFHDVYHTGQVQLLKRLYKER